MEPTNPPPPPPNPNYSVPEPPPNPNYSVPPPAPVVPAGPPPYPLFCKIIFIVDACLSGVRLIFIPLALIGLAALQKSGNPLAPTALPELVTHIGIFIFGISAPIVMLLRKRWGMGLAAFAVLFTLASIGIGVWQASIQIGAQAFPQGSPERIGFFIGAGCVIVFRVALLVLYGVALAKFERWSRYLSEPQELGYQQ